MEEKIDELSSLLDNQRETSEINIVYLERELDAARDMYDAFVEFVRRESPSLWEQYELVNAAKHRIIK